MTKVNKKKILGQKKSCLSVWICNGKNWQILAPKNCQFAALKKANFLPSPHLQASFIFIESVLYLIISRAGKTYILGIIGDGLKAPLKALDNL